MAHQSHQLTEKISLRSEALLITGALTAFAVTAALASPGIARGQSAAATFGVISGSQQDKAFGADMGVVHELLADHNKIKRSVTKLPNGIRTVTESDDPQVAREIKAHVASMDQRLKDSKVFNVASHTLPTIFANKDKIHTEIQQTPTGVILTQTSSDPATVAALQAHAGEVSELARDGMPALMRSVMANGGPMSNGNGGMMIGSGPMMGHMMHQMMRAHGASPLASPPQVTH